MSGEKRDGNAPSGIGGGIRAAFVTGLLLCLPVSLTIYIIVWLVNFLASPARGSFQYFLQFFGVELEPTPLVNAGMTILSALTVAAGIAFVGFVSRNILGRVFFSGTSNVMYAKDFGLIPMGTMAHEYLQACQALGPRLRDSQTYGFQMWAKEYRGDLGIALADVYGTEPFLKDFDMYFCKLFDGARHDSGDPFIWGEKMIEHYAANKCDPRSKTLIFSDSLDFPRIIELYRRFNHRIRMGFGVGTNLMNDLGPQPLNIVMKMVRCNGQPVAKISDTPGKGMCEDETYLAYLKQVFGIKQ